MNTSYAVFQSQDIYPADEGFALKEHQVGPHREGGVFQENRFMDNMFLDEQRMDQRAMMWGTVFSGTSIAKPKTPHESVAWHFKNENREISRDALKGFANNLQRKLEETKVVGHHGSFIWGAVMGIALASGVVTYGSLVGALETVANMKTIAALGGGTVSATILGFAILVTSIAESLRD